LIPPLLVCFMVALYGASSIQKVETEFFPYVTLTVSGERLALDQVRLYENDLLIERIVSFQSFESWSQKPLDLVFVYDLSWSMSNYLESFRSGLISLIAQLRDQGYDIRLSWIGFAGELLHIYPCTQSCNQDPEFTDDIRAFEDYLSKVMNEVRIPPGFEECQIQALYKASMFRFRNDAVKLIVLITDEDTRDDPTRNVPFVDPLKEQILSKGLTIVPVFSQDEPDPVFEELALFSGGKSYPFLPGSIIAEEGFTFGGYFWEFLRILVEEHSATTRITYYSPGKFGERKGTLRHSVSETAFTYRVPEIKSNIRVLGLDTQDYPRVSVYFTPELGEMSEAYSAMENGDSVVFSRSVHVSPYRPEEVDLVLIVDMANSAISDPLKINENVNTLVQFCKDSSIDLRLGAVIPLDNQTLYQDLTQDLDQVKNLLSRYVKVKPFTNAKAIPEFLCNALNFHFRANSQKAVVLITDSFQDDLRKGFEAGALLIDAIVSKSMKNNIGLFFVSQKNDYIDYINRMTPGSRYGFGEKPTHLYLVDILADFFQYQQVLTYESEALDQSLYDPSFFALSEKGDRLFIQFFQFSDLLYQTRLRINTVTAFPNILHVSEEALLTCLAYPHKNVAYRWECAEGSFTSANGKSEIGWKAPQKEGFYNVIVEVSSGQIKMKGSVVIAVQP